MDYHIYSYSKIYFIETKMEMYKFLQLYCNHISCKANTLDLYFRKYIQQIPSASLKTRLICKIYPLFYLCHHLYYMIYFIWSTTHWILRPNKFPLIQIKFYYFLVYLSITVWLKWISPLCSRYASPPPLWEKFSSSFIFWRFSHWNFKIWKMSKKD